MPDNNELVSMMRSVIQEELKPVNARLAALDSGQQELRQNIQELRQDVQELRQGQQELRQDVQELRQGQQELRQDVQGLKQGQAALETALNDLRASNRATHKKIFTLLDAIWDDVKRIDNRFNVHEEEAIR